MTQRDDLNRIFAYLNRLNEERRTTLQPIDELRFLELTDKDKQKLDSFEGYGKRELTLGDTTDWSVFTSDETWGSPDYHCIFAFSVDTTKQMEGRKIGVSVDTGATDIWNTDNPQIMVYVNGSLTCAMDLNHNEVILSESAKSGVHYDIRLYAYVNSAKKSNFLYVKVFAVEPEAEALYYDMKAPIEAAALFRPEDDRREKLLQILHGAGDLLDLREKGSESYLESIRQASRYLEENLYDKEWDANGPEVYAIGHTHIDVAWKWPLRQTKEKAVRSFSTVLYLMEKYPEYRFMSSQPQLYQYVKEEEPQLFEKIKEKVKEGRWETEGAMWLESDCNLTSGESLVRQILLGKEFFKKEFDVDRQDILWLPDAFGFLGALPQIMKRSGLSYFLTTKMGWNEADQQPDDTFLWEGIDGSRVLGTYITTKNYETYPERFEKPVREVTYNGRQNANQIMGTWQNYRNKRINDVTMTLYGYGDGGGGPTQGMLEESKRLSKGLLGVPKVKMAGVADYYEKLKENLAGKELNVWYGDLYLEYHRGTFSSIADSKKNNRRCEYKMQEAEWLAAMAWLLRRSEYPAEKLEEAWKLLLLNQFHDILPGSAIGEVYEQAAKDYEKISVIDTEIEKQAKNAILGLAASVANENADKANGTKDTAVVWNPLGFKTRAVINLDKEQADAITNLEGALAKQEMSDHSVKYVLDLPAKGYRSFKNTETGFRSTQPFAVSKEGQSLDTPWYKVSWNESGELTSLFDKEAKRELIQKGRVGNEIRVYEDIPKDYDAWNVDAFYERKFWKMKPEGSCTVKEYGDICAVLSVTLKYLDSTVNQDIIFYSDSRRIDFKTKIDWKQQQQLVKAVFPLDIVSRKAVCEIPFGTIERATHRNTSWDRARFEMCAHRFVDLSEPGYGAALLNDCKYGYSVKDSELALTLLTSGIFPFADADKGEHKFTYALLPHMGDYRSGHVMQEAYLLNWKPAVQMLKQPIDAEYSMLEISRENIFADAVKVSQDGKDLILRTYEGYGERTFADLNLNGIMQAAADKAASIEVWECDLMENCESLCETDGNTVYTEWKPFEIKTFRIRFC